MISTNPPHEFFDRLCAMSAANQASVEEEGVLAEHLESCSSCKESLRQYRQIVIQTFEEGAAHQSESNAFEATGIDRVEHRTAKERLLREIPGVLHLPLSGTPPTARAIDNGFKPTRHLPFGVPAWAAGGVAACLLLLLLASGVRYWMPDKHATNPVINTDATARASSLEKQIEELKQELGKAQTDRQHALAETQSRATSEAQKLQAENEELRQNLSESESARNREASDNDALQNRVRLLQSSLDMLQTSNAGLETEKTDLLQKVSNLTSNLREAQDQTKSAKARSEELAQTSLTQVRFVERQQKLLATDRDLRDILGARTLRIIDVYDVGSHGEFEQPFGRIFYTEGKSLVFYAFDLDKQKGLKSGAVFQAWGEKGEGKDTPRSLGAFYMDDPPQNRWILKVDDTKLLSRIDYVFVTDSAGKEGVKPRGKPLLSAFLNNSINHP